MGTQIRQLMVVAFVAACVLQATERNILSLDDLPGIAEWKNSPVHWNIEDGRLTIVAGPSTDWYVSPLDGKATNNAPLLLFQAGPEFVLTAKVTVEFGAKWDAGMLMVYASDTNWAKFALEKSVWGEPTIVTVVTRGVSDDCNSSPVTGNSIWYRIARVGPAFAFYASPDGHSWKMIRAFTLGSAPDVRAGFGSQSPVGQRGTATFSEIRYSARRIGDIFKGE